MLPSKGKMKGGLGYLKGISNEYQANLVLIRIWMEPWETPISDSQPENVMGFQPRVTKYAATPGKRNSPGNPQTIPNPLNKQRVVTVITTIYDMETFNYSRTASDRQSSLNENTS
ncbi:hypothetical protein SAMN04488121_102277 [Chitinophaga filiformis]|uniref:Uncharacterized protein n=1 Tax=Chitinophaga filiformis TaxID=104663 RepID=A0A1G7M325_CHIFI|nr:hypothetical protein SAMN04488121_102277 [Chitinophaga filiformis]